MPLTLEEKKLKQKVRSDRWYAKHRDLAIQRAYARYLQDPVGHRERMRADHQLYRDARLRHQHEYRRENLGKIKAQDKAWKDANKPLLAASGKVYRAKNADRLKEYGKQWRQRNKARIRANIWKRKALKKAATINLAGINQWMRNVLSKPFARCYYCDSRISTKAIHFDHIVALSKGGAHSVANLCVACAPCNLSKSDKPIRAWIRTGQGILEL